MRRKGLGILLVLCLLLGALTLSMSAADSTAAYTEIGTADDLIALMNNPDGWTGNYRLTADINLADYAGELEQAPIGTGASQFKGIFDGNGKTVSGVNLVDTATAASANANWGFFGYVQGGEVRGLTLEGTISTTGRRAGMVGAINGSATIENCTNKCAISANANAAGIVGFAAPANGVTITDCKNYGEITGTSASYATQTGVGGILGATNASGKITIAGCANYGDVTGIQVVGGIAGYFYGADKTATALTSAAYKLYNCMNAGTVTATSKTQTDLGGILGVAYQVSGIHSCLNNGAVVATNTCSKLYVGGICGRAVTVGKIAYSYNAVAPTVPAGTGTYVRGIVGYPAAKNCVSNYYAAGMSEGLSANTEYTDDAFATLNTQGFWLETTNGPELRSFHVHDYQNGKCTTCGAEQATHTPDYVWKFDGTNFYYTCADEGCGVVLHTQTEAPTLYVDAHTKATAVVGDDANDGLTKTTAVLTIEEAFRRLANVGGTVCLCDRYYVSAALDLPANSEKITVTSDPKTGFFFEKTNLRVRINGDVEFNNLYFYADKNAARLIVFVCNWHDVTFGEGLATSVNAYVFAGTEDTGDDTDAQNQTLVFRGVNQTTATGTSGDNLSEARRFYDTIVLGSRTNATGFTNVTANKTITATFGNFVYGEYTFAPQVGSLRCATSSQSENANIENCETTIDLNDDTTVSKLIAGDKNMNTGAAALDKLTVALNDNAIVTDEIGLFNIKQLVFTASSGASRTVQIPVKLVATFSSAYAADGTESLAATYGTHSFAAATGMGDGLKAGANYNETYANAVTENVTDECSFAAAVTTTDTTATCIETCTTCGRTGDTLATLTAGTQSAATNGTTSAIRFITNLKVGTAEVEYYGTFIAPLADSTIGSGSFADENLVYARSEGAPEANSTDYAVDLVGIPADKADTTIYAWAFVKLQGVDNLVVLPLAGATVNGLMAK